MLVWKLGQCSPVKVHGLCQICDALTLIDIGFWYVRLPNLLLFYALGCKQILYVLQGLVLGCECLRATESVYSWL